MKKAQAAPTGDPTEQKLLKLDQEIRQFHVDSRRFMAGDLDVPPEELMERIVATIRQIRTSKMRGVADNFRLNSLEARFNSHRELHNRRLRERERKGVGRVLAGRDQLDPTQGIIFGENGDRQAVETLYKGLYLKSGTSNPKMDLERFRSYLHRQADVIRAKTGCTDIHFRIDTQDGGKAKIKAKPIRRR
ncbi:MAG: hypothetical protein AAF725_07535 [Acidobacteriota bacterium]